MPSEYKPPKYRLPKMCLKMPISPGLIFGILRYIGMHFHKKTHRPMLNVCAKSQDQEPGFQGTQSTYHYTFNLATKTFHETMCKTPWDMLKKCRKKIRLLPVEKRSRESSLKLPKSGKFQQKLANRISETSSKNHLHLFIYYIKLFILGTV